MVIFARLNARIKENSFIILVRFPLYVLYAQSNRRVVAHKLTFAVLPTNRRFVHA